MPRNSRAATPADRIVDLYERHAADYARERGEALIERAWIERFLARVPAGGTILDAGCGNGAVAALILASGRDVVGIDSSPSMIAACRTRFPDAEWVAADMRELDLDRRFDGLIAWDSFFHLDAGAQRGMFSRFAAHARPGAPLMFTSGPSAGEAIGEWHGEPLFHASLDAGEYEALLNASGFRVVAHVANDPSCGDHTIWLAELC